MRSRYFHWSLFGIAACAIAAGVSLLFLLPALPLPWALLISWLLGGIVAAGIAYGFARRQAARSGGEPAPFVPPLPGSRHPGNRDRYAAQLKEIERYLSALAQGSLEARLVVDGEEKAPDPLMQDMGRHAKALSTRLGGVLNEITTATDLIGDIAGSTETVMYQNEQAMRPIVTAVEQIAAGAAGQTQSTLETAQMIEELAVTTTGIANGARAQAASVAHANQVNRRVLEIVEAANQAAGDAQQAGRQTAADMDSIRGSVSAAAEKVQAMNQRSMDIRLILEILENIAAQTRLLTVNAAIEAARAGEGGRGFAVVAEEVRRLSENSNASVTTIRELVAEIINASQESVDSMKEIDMSVAEGVHSAQRAAETLDEIGSAFQAIQAAVSELSDEMQAVSGVVEENTVATEQMAASSRHVKAAMEQVASITRENEASIAQIETSISNISQFIIEATVSAQSMLDMAYSIQSAVARMQRRPSQAMAAPAADRGKEKLTIGLALPFTMSRSFWRKMTLFAQKGAEELGVELVVMDAEDDPQRMWSNYQELLQRRVDGIMVVPHHDLAPRMLEEAARQSIPVVLLDTYLRGVQPQIGGYENYVAFVGPSNAGIGYRIADYLFSVQPDSRVAALIGQAGHLSSIQRAKGLEYALRKHPSARLVARVDSDFTREEGERACTAVLAAHPDINAVWAIGDPTAVGAIDAIKRFGKIPGRDVLVVGTGLNEENLPLIEKGEQLCDASVHWMVAGLGLVVLHDVLQGCTLPYQRAIIKLNLGFLTAGQVESYTRILTPDGLLPFDFRRHSQVFNPAAQIGQFEVEVG